MDEKLLAILALRPEPRLLAKVDEIAATTGAGWNSVVQSETFPVCSPLDGGLHTVRFLESCKLHAGIIPLSLVRTCHLPEE
jgi:hypothetical protein